MAFSTTANHLLTGTDIITEALEIIGVLAEGESPSSDASASALRSLNNIIKLWSADTQIYAQDEYVLDLVADDGEYQLGTGNVGYIPNKILRASLIHSTDNNEIPLRMLTNEEWYSLTNKASSGIPTQFYQKRNPTGVDMDLYLWPVQTNTDYDLKLWIQYPLRDVDSASDDVYFTQEWFLALSFELAFVLAHKYGVDIRERAQLKEASDMYYALASSYDKDGSVYLQPQVEHG